MRRVFLALLLGMSTLSHASLADSTGTPSDDVIARVGDQPITFGQVNTMLNSSAVVGLSIPALGTPQRDQVRIALLDKIVSANLIYLDALRLGVEQQPAYRNDLRRFQNSILAGLYRQKELMAETDVSEEEIQQYARESLVPGTELTEEVRTQVAAILRKGKSEQFKLRLTLLLDSLRHEKGVKVHEQNIYADGDADRPDDAVVATLGKEKITWGEVKSTLIGAGRGAVKRNILAMEEDGRTAALNAEIDSRLLAGLARKAGMEQDPVYLGRLAEYRKTRLINLHRAELARSFEPDELELIDYYEKNRAKIRIPEARKLQLVVVESEQQARELKDAIENGKTTMHKAARDFSIDPGAKTNLGEIGWVLPGEGQPTLDKLLFELGPGEIGGPVQTPTGWHLLKVLDIREEQFGDLSQSATQKRVRRAYIHDKLDKYTVDLRLNHFPVEVYEEKLVKLAQAEADMVKQLAEKAQQPGSVTQTRLQELQKGMQKK